MVLKDKTPAMTVESQHSFNVGMRQDTSPGTVTSALDARSPSHRFLDGSRPHGTRLIEIECSKLPTLPKNDVAQP
jgi:hypothetical protein